MVTPGYCGRDARRPRLPGVPGDVPVCRRPTGAAVDLRVPSRVAGSEWVCEAAGTRRSHAAPKGWTQAACRSGWIHHVPSFGRCSPPSVDQEAGLEVGDDEWPGLLLAEPARLEDLDPGEDTEHDVDRDGCPCSPCGNCGPVGRLRQSRSHGGDSCSTWSYLNGGPVPTCAAFTG